MSARPQAIIWTNTCLLFIGPVVCKVTAISPGLSLMIDIQYLYHSKNMHGYCHDDVIKWKHFPRHWPFVRGIHRSPVNSLHKGQWRGALMFCLICTRINGSVNNGEAGNLRRHRAHYDVIVMFIRMHGTLLSLSSTSSFTCSQSSFSNSSIKEYTDYILPP